MRQSEKSFEELAGRKHKIIMLKQYIENVTVGRYAKHYGILIQALRRAEGGLDVT